MSMLGIRTYHMLLYLIPTPLIGSNHGQTDIGIGIFKRRLLSRMAYSAYEIRLLRNTKWERKGIL